MDRHILVLWTLIGALCSSAWGACANTNLGSGVTCVQDVNGSMTSNTSFTLALNGTTAGHEIMVFVGIYYITQTSISVTGANTYHQKVSAAGAGSTGMAQIWTAENIAGGNETITVTCTGSDCGYTVATAAEYSGLATSGSFDQSAVNTNASGTSYTSGSTPNTGQANELLVGMVALLSPSLTCTPDTSTVSWSLLDRSTDNSYHEICTQQAIVTATGAFQANGTLSSAAASVGVVATFKASGGGSIPPAQWNTGTGGAIYYSGGNVGIGTATPVHPLHVAGAIGAEEVIVSATGADYVFDPGYRLAPLTEVAGYIMDHHHLPDVPSAEEMQQKGAGVGEMQAKLLAKIEEITLHMIQAEERSSRLEQQNRDLQERIERLESNGSQPAAQ